MSISRCLTVVLALSVGLACSTASGGAAESGAAEPGAAVEGAPAEGQAASGEATPEPGATAASGAPEARRDTMEEGQRPGVAVFPFVNGGSYGEDAEDLEALQVGLQQMLLTELDQNEELRIVERSMLKDIMEEQDLGTTDRVDASTAARVGQLVGAQYMITGVFVDLYGDFRMDARIIDAETGEIVQTERVRGEKEQLYDLLVQLSTRITEGADLPPLPMAVREERTEREIPPEAITLYSRAQVYQDRGYDQRAIEVYQRIVEEFPEMEEARTALRQLRG